MKIYLDTDRAKVEEVHDALSTHFELPKGRVKSYSEVIEYNEGYGFLVSLSGNHDVSSLIDSTKVIDYIVPEPEEEVVDA